MKYTIQPGVILKNVMDEYFLISTGEAHGVCPDIRQLNPAGAQYWQMLEVGADKTAMLECASSACGVSVEALAPGLEAFLAELEKCSYITVEEK